MGRAIVVLLLLLLLARCMDWTSDRAHAYGQPGDDDNDDENDSLDRARNCALFSYMYM